MIVWYKWARIVYALHEWNETKINNNNKTVFQLRVVNKQYSFVPVFSLKDKDNMFLIYLWKYILTLISTSRLIPVLAQHYSFIVIFSWIFICIVRRHEYWFTLDYFFNRLHSKETDSRKMKWKREMDWCRSRCQMVVANIWSESGKSR